MSRGFLIIGTAASVLFLPSAAGAQESDLVEVRATEVPETSETAEESEADSIFVRGTRLPGATISGLEPEVSLSEAEIEAYGVSSLEELLGAIDTLVASGRGRRGSGPPIILLDCVRVGSFREIRRYPSEALQRVDVLPEDAAVRYGFRADQRVVNFVLKPGFQSIGAEITAGGPSQGGRSSVEGEFSRLRVGDHRRTNFDASYEKNSSLLESERRIVSVPSTEPYSQRGVVASDLLGDEIDPGLSALLGYTATSVYLPEGADVGLALSDFAQAESATGDDITQFRTLLPETEEFSFGATHFRSDGDGRFVTFSVTADFDRSRSLLGLPPVKLSVPADNDFSPFSEDVAIYRYLSSENVLTRDTENFDAQATITTDGPIGDWRYNVITSYNYAKSETDTERSADVSAIQALISQNDPDTNPFSVSFPSVQITKDHAQTTSEVLSLDGTLTGFLGELPAGEIATTLRGKFSTTTLSSQSDGGASSRDIDLSRDGALLRGTIAFPLLRRDQENDFGLGTLSVDVRGEIENLSDIGTIATYGAGMRWSPVDPLTLSASWRTEDGAPSITSLGNPLLDTPAVQFFDFVNGESVFVTRRSGGNPDLIDDTRDVLALGARFQLRKDPDISLNTDYTDERIENPISSFPALTAEIEAAFPDRFVREDGVLTFIDTRPINYESQERRELRTSLDLRKRLGSSGPPGARTQPRGGRDAAQSGAPSGARGEQSEARPGRSSSRGSARGRGFIGASLVHTMALEEQIVVANGGPVLDLLNGSASGDLGGQPEHKISLRLRGGYNGIGMRINGDWQSGTFVANSSGNGDLEFSSLATVDVSAFAYFDRRQGILNTYPWLKGARVQLQVDNIFDERLTVRDETGQIPLSYQPTLIDPQGRSIRVSFSKRFY